MTRVGRSTNRPPVHRCGPFAVNTIDEILLESDPAGTVGGGFAGGIGVCCWDGRTTGFHVPFLRQFGAAFFVWRESFHVSAVPLPGFTVRGAEGVACRLHGNGIGSSHIPSGGLDFLRGQRGQLRTSGGIVCGISAQARPGGGVAVSSERTDHGAALLVPVPAAKSHESHQACSGTVRLLSSGPISTFL